MESGDKKTTTTTAAVKLNVSTPPYSNSYSLSPPSTSSSSPTSSLPPSPPATTTVIASPCAACKILRRRCVEKCVLAPYFPPSDPLKFTIAHRIFGASNIIKLLQELPEHQRADAVSSMVYEANARIRDPVYGTAGAICQLQQQVSELQAELAKAQAEVVNMQCQHANLVAFICMEMSKAQDHQEQPISLQPYENNLNLFSDDGNLGHLLETLWT